MKAWRSFFWRSWESNKMSGMASGPLTSVKHILLLAFAAVSLSFGVHAQDGTFSKATVTLSNNAANGTSNYTFKGTTPNSANTTLPAGALVTFTFPLGTNVSA